MSYFKENIFKNVVTIVCVLISIPFIEHSVTVVEDKSIEALMGLFGLLLVYTDRSSIPIINRDRAYERLCR